MAIPAIALAAIISGGAQLLGSGISALSSKRQQDRANVFNKQQIDEQNAYNSPLQQAIRYAQAGVNPYVQQYQNVQTDVAQMQPADLSPAIMNSANAVGDIGYNSISAKSQLETIKSQQLYNEFFAKDMENQLKLSSANASRLQSLAEMSFLDALYSSAERAYLFPDSENIESRNAQGFVNGSAYGQQIDGVDGSTIRKFTADRIDNDAPMDEDGNRNFNKYPAIVRLIAQQFDEKDRGYAYALESQRLNLLLQRDEFRNLHPTQQLALLAQYRYALSKAQFDIDEVNLDKSHQVFSHYFNTTMDALNKTSSLVGDVMKFGVYRHLGRSERFGRTQDYDYEVYDGEGALSQMYRMRSRPDIAFRSWRASRK